MASVIDLETGRDLAEKLAAQAVQEEEDFATLIIGSTTEGIVALDRHFRYTLWNAAMERISGRAKEDVLGRSCFEVFPFLVRNGLDGYVRRALAGEITVQPEAEFVVPESSAAYATVLEAFRIVAQSGFRPERTLEFMAYAAEEAGLLGSQAIAKQYKADSVPVFGVMQFDMTLYPGKTPSLTLIEDYTHAELTKFTSVLLDTYVKTSWRMDKCGYGCSDHASWTKAGFVSAFPFEATMGTDNPKIHTTGDTLENSLDAEYGTHFVRLALAFLVEMSGEKARAF